MVAATLCVSYRELDRKKVDIKNTLVRMAYQSNLSVACVALDICLECFVSVRSLFGPFGFSFERVLEKARDVLQMSCPTFDSPMLAII